MKAEELTLAELVDLTTVVRLARRRLVLHSSDALAQLRKDLVEMVGVDQAGVCLRGSGISGAGGRAAMKRIFQWDSLADWLRAGPRMHTLQESCA